MTPKHWDHNLFFISRKAPSNCQFRLLIRTYYLRGSSGGDVRHSWGGAIWACRRPVPPHPHPASNSWCPEESHQSGESSRETQRPLPSIPHTAPTIFSKCKRLQCFWLTKVFPLHLGQNPNTLLWATTLYFAHAFPGTLSSSVLPWFTVLHILALWNLFSLSLAQCPPHGFPGQALAQCSQLNPEFPVQNAFLWKQFPELQSLFQLIPTLYSCFVLFIFCLCSASELTWNDYYLFTDL